MNNVISPKIEFQDYSSFQPGVLDFHMHAVYELYLLLEGEINFYIDKSCYHLLPGSLVIINDLEVHKAITLTKTPHRRIFIHISQDFFRQYGKEISPPLDHCFVRRPRGEQNLLILSPYELSEYYELYSKMKQASSLNIYGNELLMETYLVQILLLVGRLYLNRTSTSPNLYSTNVLRIISYMEEHMTEELSLDEMANDLLISKYYLCHQFKEETGTTIFRHLLLQRISLAKSLLQQGKNASETCELAGFGNYSNFITTFRKVTGFSPKQYQLQYKDRKE